VFDKLVDVVGEKRVSNSEMERVIYSGDPSALPQFHYRWKGKYLADYAVRVENVTEIEGILEIAREHNIAVIPRGGASSCMCSSSPTRGGITLDIKTMNKVLEINQKEMFVRVEPGVTFEGLRRQLENEGLTLGIYPSSAKSAVIGGWIAVGGRAGIGTPYYGGLRDHIISLSVVGGDGSVKTLEGEDINLFHNSYGILGVIFEIKLKIYKNVPRYKSFSYVFETIEGLCNVMVEIASWDLKPVYLKIADSELQKYSNPLQFGKYVLSVTYDELHADTVLDDLQKMTWKNVGVSFDDEFSGKEWDFRYDCEFNPKQHTETLMFQEYWMPVERVCDMLLEYEKYHQSYKIPTLWFGMLGSQNEMRLNLMVMINAKQYLKFIASKGILHKIMKKAIKLGGEPYTIGLQNSIYMSRACPERMIQMREAKEKWDPVGIMNPDRVTSCLTSYRRIDVLFLLAIAFRWFSKYIDR
jgi:FAD/FMN-containing dehydrogenase